MDSDSEVELMKRGGRKRRPARATQSQKVKQSQIVNVKVHVGDKAKPRARAKKAVGDMVMLLPDRMKLFKAKYTPAEPIRAAGPGFFFANAPAPSQASAYGNAPTAIRPLSSGRFVAAADHSKDANQNKDDDIRIPVNPSGIVTGVKEVRALPSAAVKAMEAIAASAASQEALQRSIRDMEPFVGRPVGPPANRVEEVRAIPSEGAQAMREQMRDAFAHFPFPLIYQDRAEQKRERARDVIADRNRLGALMQAEKHLESQGASEEERAALYRENMRRGGRLSLF
ncbi:hypothetical protein EBT31_07205 [bacterium]|jgi:hypothetical protein|nr:hypothetical protein [bacterium]NBX50653.1 hypothetical protein [bacterium]